MGFVDEDSREMLRQQGIPSSPIPGACSAIHGDVLLRKNCLASFANVD